MRGFVVAFVGACFVSAHATCFLTGMALCTVYTAVGSELNDPFRPFPRFLLFLLALPFQTYLPISLFICGGLGRVCSFGLGGNRLIEVFIFI